ncbi:MAG: helix-turn-helix domain-containing protein [Alicyclobacillus sp.]|nr:helix-turn-helix domain-containing protein [Alicyclobacillus sp.]
MALSLSVLEDKLIKHRGRFFGCLCPIWEKREVWRQRIAAFYDSGLPARQFCAEHGLNPHQFRYWLRRLQDSETAPGTQSTAAFVSVMTTSSGLEPSRSPLTLRIGSVEIDVRPGYDASTLVELIQLVMRVC